MHDDGRDAVDDVTGESKQSLPSLYTSLTEGRKSPYREDVLSLKTTSSTSPKTPQRTETDLLSRDEVGALLARPDLPIGIDCLAFSFDTGALLIDDQGLWKETTRKTGAVMRYATNFPLERGSVYLSIHRNGMGSWGYAEVKPTTVLYGSKSTCLASLDEALEVFHTVMDEIEQIVHVRTDRLAIRLSRVDTTVDAHNVASRQDILAVAQWAPYRKGLKTCTYTGSRGYESVICRTKKGGGFAVYDKSLQAKSKASIVRFEVGTRRKRLKKVCPTIGDLTNEICRELFTTFLGPLIEALSTIPRTDVDNILANKKHRHVLIEALGLSVLRDKGYVVEMTDYWWKKLYGPFKKTYPHNAIGDVFGA